MVPPIPVSDASNARLRPPQPHFRSVVAAGARHQGVADMYADGFDRPDRFWAIAWILSGRRLCLNEFDSREVASALAS